jgi:Ca2+-transporting ATPase
MSILPEEIPVAFTTFFMALGSEGLMKKVLSLKKNRTVKTLGSATVICTDKTGTITENTMSLQSFTFEIRYPYKKTDWNNSHKTSYRASNVG